MNWKMAGEGEKLALIPAFSPEEKEKLFPRLGDWITVSGRWFRGQCANFFGGISRRPSPRGEGERGVPRVEKMMGWDGRWFMVRTHS